MYTALYRAQRPEVFSEILGQEHIVKILKYQIATDTVSHAYLFCGTRGTGKTTTARILAKAVNCLGTSGDGEFEEDDERPCGHCANCVAIKNGTFMDVIEIDAASNNGVDSIRELRESVKYPPAVGKKKVYIIDEVHMLSTGAFNALLKTLEEPPENVMFILATTEPQKLPATILSRCMRLDFKRVPLQTLADGMRRICEDKGIEITEGAVRLLANSADGSVRDGLSILDQVIAAGDKQIDREEVLEYIGTAGEDFFIELTDLVAVHNVAEALVLLDRALADGKDVKQLMKDWTAHYRSLLITKFIKNPEDMLNMSTENIDRIRKQSRQISLEEINDAILRLSKTIQDARWSTQPRILLELAIVAIATDLIDEEKLTPRTASVPAPVAAPAAVPAAPGGQTFAAMPTQDTMQASEPAVPVSSAAAASPSAAQSQEKAAEDSALPKTAAAIPDQTPTMSQAQMDDLWHQIFEEGEGSASSFNLIRSGTTLGNVGESQFTVLAKTGFAQRYAEKMRPELEHLMERHLGRHLKMVCRRESEEQKKEADSQFENLAKMASETLGIHVEIE
ncbi:MAG: DNA polymerase III subunit gamma/tau [Anaerovoracaceae bacterium]